MGYTMVPTIAGWKCGFPVKLSINTFKSDMDNAILVKSTSGSTVTPVVTPVVTVLCIAFLAGSASPLRAYCDSPARDKQFMLETIAL